VIYSPDRRGGTPFASYPVALLLVGMLVGGAAVSLGHAARRGSPVARVALGVGTALVGGTLGAIGTALAIAWLFTQYRFTAHNENLLILNPLLIAAIPLGGWYAWGSPRAARVLWHLLALCIAGGLTAIMLKALPGSSQDNWRTLLLTIPTVAGLAAGLRLALLQRVPVPERRTDHHAEVVDPHQFPPAQSAPTHPQAWSPTS
jgi:hypothetical protein